jgi:hypothetical protein
MCDLVTLADKYGIAGLVILALFVLQWVRGNQDATYQSRLYDEISNNTKATVELTAKLGSICLNRRTTDS